MDKNYWQIQRKLRTLTCMSEGVVRYLYVAVLGTASILSAADELLPPSLPGANPSLVATNVAPIVIAPTNNPAEGVLPIVGGGTNAVLTAEERRNAELEEARKQAEEAYQKKLSNAKEKWKAATNNLGVYHLIPEKNPFRLKIPEIEKPRPIVSKTPMTIGVPHLAGISMLRDKMRAVLRINPLKGGAAEYKFIPVGEMVDGVEVMKIDAVNGVVEVKVKGKIHPLELVPAQRVNVKELQQALNAKLKSSRKLKVDGDFGSNTRKALMQFQRLKKLPDHGRVDEATRKALGLSAFPKRTKLTSPRK